MFTKFQFPRLLEIVSKLEQPEVRQIRRIVDLLWKTCLISTCSKECQSILDSLSTNSENLDVQDRFKKSKGLVNQVWRPRRSSPEKLSKKARAFAEIRMPCRSKLGILSPSPASTLNMFRSGTMFSLKVLRPRIRSCWTRFSGFVDYPNQARVFLAVSKPRGSKN